MSAKITLQPIRFPADSEVLVQLLAENAWPFHTSAQLTEATVRERIDSHYYDGDERESYWVMSGNERAGYLAIEDIEEIPNGTPVFDLRIAEKYRGQGVGVGTLAALADLVFRRWPVRRLEGQTRHDNKAMRAVFLKAGWVKEAHYRQGWPAGEGVWADSIAYAILRDDWENGTRTEIDWSQ